MCSMPKKTSLFICVKYLELIHRFRTIRTICISEVLQTLNNSRLFAFICGQIKPLRSLRLRAFALRFSVLPCQQRFVFFEFCIAESALFEFGFEYFKALII